MSSEHKECLALALAPPALLPHLTGHPERIFPARSLVQQCTCSVTCAQVVQLTVRVAQFTGGTTTTAATATTTTTRRVHFDFSSAPVMPLREAHAKWNQINEISSDLAIFHSPAQSALEQSFIREMRFVATSSGGGGGGSGANLGQNVAHKRHWRIQVQLSTCMIPIYMRPPLHSSQ